MVILRLVIPDEEIVELLLGPTRGRIRKVIVIKCRCRIWGGGAGKFANRQLIEVDMNGSHIQRLNEEPDLAARIIRIGHLTDNLVVDAELEARSLRVHAQHILRIGVVYAFIGPLRQHRQSGWRTLENIPLLRAL